jgi:hypothetical protein
MEPEGSIPCSQEPSTGPYPEPYQSNPLHPILHLRLGFLSGLFPSGFNNNILHAFLFSHIRARWVPCHHGMARPHVAYGGQLQSRTADKGWSSSLGVGRGVNNSP